MVVTSDNIDEARSTGASINERSGASELELPDPRADSVGATAPEFRMDPFSGEWVIIAGGRQSRPALPQECPFCVGGLEAKDPYIVKAFTNRWPVMRSPNALGLGPEETAKAIEALEARRSTYNGHLFDTVPAIGEAEVVLYSPDHDASLGNLSDAQLSSLFALWKERTLALSSLDHVRYVLIFENRGPEVGVTIEHPHGQIYAFPLVPPRIRREIERASDLADRNRIRCITCEVAKLEGGGPRLVFEDDFTLAYVPYASAWPYALYLLPKRHLGSIDQLENDEAASLMKALRKAYAAADLIFDTPLPTMMAFLQRPVPKKQEESPVASWHLRVEIVSPMRKRGLLRYVAGAEVSTALLQNPVQPEAAASHWREAFQRVPSSRHAI